MKKFFQVVLAITVMVLLSSCFEIENVLIVNKDGSAIIEETALLNGQVKGILNSPAAQGAEASNPDVTALKELLPDKEKTDERAKALGEGVTVKSREEIKAPDGREGVKVVYAVKDIRKLKYQPLESKEKSRSQPVTFGLSGDTLTVNLPEEPKGPDVNDTQKIPAEQMQAQITALKPMMAGMRIAFKIKMKAGLASTNASHAEGDEVTVLDLKFDKLMEKPEGVNALISASQDDKAGVFDAGEAFKGIDGVVIESKKSFTIKLK